MSTKLLHGDCLELMPSLPDNSVDMVLCDLPYGVTKNHWDSIIPMDKLWEQWRRIAKPSAAIILFGQGMFTAKVMQSNHKEWRYNLIWDKILTSGFLNANRMPLRRHEDMMVFYRQLPVFNPQMAKRKTHIRAHTKLRGSTNNNYGNYKNLPTVYSDDTYPDSIIACAKDHSASTYHHPTEKPVTLLRYLIASYTNVGDTVLDNTMGSGSTGVAAIMEHRSFIGIELEKKYFDIASKRIKEAEAEMASRLF